MILQVAGGIQPEKRLSADKAPPATTLQAKQKLIGDSVSYSQLLFKVNENLGLRDEAL
jgi:hypothetical protein